MKKFIATVLLSLAVSPAFAGDVYDAVSSQRITDAQSRPVEGATFSPLYRQVTGEGKRGIDLEQARIDTMTEFTYSPLYLKVTGKMG
jgi:hypothetical protein